MCTVSVTLTEQHSGRLPRPHCSPERPSGTNSRGRRAEPDLDFTTANQQSLGCATLPPTGQEYEPTGTEHKAGYHIVDFVITSLLQLQTQTQNNQNLNVNGFSHVYQPLLYKPINELPVCIYVPSLRRNYMTKEKAGKVSTRTSVPWAPPACVVCYKGMY